MHNPKLVVSGKTNIVYSNFVSNNTVQYSSNYLFTEMLYLYIVSNLNINELLGQHVMKKKRSVIMGATFSSDYLI